MKVLQTSNQESKAVANISESSAGNMVMGDWKQYIGNGEVINNFSVPVQVWSNDRGVYQIPAGERSEAWGEDVDHVRDGRGNWWKIGWNVAVVDELGNVHNASCRTPTFGVDCPEEEIEDLGGTGGEESTDAGVPLPGGVQPKLEVNQPNDRFEQEADAVAEKVVQSDQSIQRKCSGCEDEELQMKPLVQLKTASRESGSSTSPWIEQQIQNKQGGGQHLPNETRSLMESGIGANFQNVKVHTDNTSVQMNRELGARAFTVGNDIFFNSGQYAPESTDGKKLLAHELTHTVQQGASDKLGRKSIIQRKEIDHRSLTWGDFQGAVPKDAVHDAETTSDIRDPKVADIKPMEPVVSEGSDACDAGGKKQLAKIEYDSSKIEVKSFMDQDASWKKGWTTIAADQEAKCKSEFVSKCKTSFTSGEAGARKSATEDLKDCEKRAAELKEGAQLAYECEGKEVLVKKGECESKMKSCFENQRIKDLTYEADNQAGDKFTVNSKAECDTKLLEACKKTLVPGMSTALLKHEQGHFDITNEIAAQIQKDLREKADSLSTEAEACSKEEAIKKARSELAKKKPADEFKKIWKAGKKKLKDTQKKYDDETKHSTVLKMQNDWNEKIAEGEI